MIFRLVNLDECSNCIRLEADLEREQKAGLLRKAERDRLVEAVNAFGKEFDRCDGSSADSVLDITIGHFENLRELLKEIAE